MDKEACTVSDKLLLLSSSPTMTCCSYTFYNMGTPCCSQNTMTTLSRHTCHIIHHLQVSYQWHDNASNVLLMCGHAAASYNMVLRRPLKFTEPRHSNPGFIKKLYTQQHTMAHTMNPSLGTTLIQHVSFAVASFSNKQHTKSVLHTHDAQSCSALQTELALLARTMCQLDGKEVATGRWQCA